MVQTISLIRVVTTVAILGSSLSAVVVAQTAEAQTPATEYRQLLNRYCVGCHNDRTLTAGVSLQHLDLSQVGVDTEETEIWEKVVRKLRTRAMPPQDRPRPDEGLSLIHI